MATAPHMESGIQDRPETSPAPEKSRFEQMFGRMNGTMTVVGDIVGPLPEVWDCERE